MAVKACIYAEDSACRSDMSAAGDRFEARHQADA
jgi:hypothetical protein